VLRAHAVQQDRATAYVDASARRQRGGGGGRRLPRRRRLLRRDARDVGHREPAHHHPTWRQRELGDVDGWRQREAQRRRRGGTHRRRRGGRWHVGRHRVLTWRRGRRLAALAA